MKLVKSQVKCYKKKTKKNVGGQKKTYEYNQYLVPLKRSDNLDCSMEVFILPQSDLDDLVDEEGQIKDISGEKEEFKRHLAEYESELAELEWKHSQLSKSYKELFKKHNKTRKKNKELEKQVESLESDREKLMDVLQKVKEARLKETNEVPKIVPQGESKESITSSSFAEKSGKIQITGFKADKTEVKPDKKIHEDKKANLTKETKETKEIKETKEEKEDKVDKDIWTVLRSRLTKKEEEEK